MHTNGFANIKQLNRHFGAHGSDVGANSPKEYEEFADQFLGGQKPPHVRECKRKLGDIVRFDPLTEVFGVLGSNGDIRTLYRPLPCSSVPVNNRVYLKQAGRCHEIGDNATYYKEECKKW